MGDFAYNVEMQSMDVVWCQTMGVGVDVETGAYSMVLVHVGLGVDGHGVLE